MYRGWEKWEWITKKCNNCEINARENNKSAKKNANKQNKTCAANKSSVQYNTYLNNKLLSWIVEYYYQPLATKQSNNAKRFGMEVTSMLLITTSTSPEIRKLDWFLSTLLSHPLYIPTNQLLSFSDKDKVT